MKTTNTEEIQQMEEPATVCTSPHQKTWDVDSMFIDIGWVAQYQTNIESMSRVCWDMCI